jgi:hypothetical protein
MLTSVLSPISIATPDTAPPWGWNPAATFLTAYNTQAQERRDQEKFNMAMQLERILLPAKAAQAEFTLNQLAYETENMANSYRLQNEMVNERRRIIRTGGSGASSNVAGNGGSSNQAPAQDEDPTSFNLTGTSYDRKPAAQSQPQTSSQPMAKKKVVDLTGV